MANMCNDESKKLNAAATNPQEPAAALDNSSTGKLTFCAILFIAFLAICSLGMSNDLFQYYDQIQHAEHRKQLQNDLGLSLTRSVWTGSLKTDRLEKVRSSIQSSFVASAKNKMGRISAAVVRYIAYRYFSHKYGWHIKGFEPHRANSTSLSSARILQTQLPQYCETVLEGTLASTGFALEDTAMLIAGIEQLVFDEIVSTTEQAYHLNHIPITQSLPQDRMQEIINSYLIENMMEGNFTNHEQHALDKGNIRELYPQWDTTQLFLKDIINAEAEKRRIKSNGYTRGARHAYTFEETARLMTKISEEFGPWVNYECKNMKDSLSNLDIHHTGRVKLSDFYGESQKGVWHFLESTEYLRALGVLDETDADLGPQVITANYILAESNCLMSTPQYSVCCMNECDSVMYELESLLQTSEASPDQIWEAMSHVTVLTPSKLLEPNSTFYMQLNEIAAQHEESVVPIHGRLFAQWLHFVFPRECVYPRTPGAVVPKTLGEWIETEGSPEIAEEDMQKHLSATVAMIPPSPQAGRKMWVIKEELMASSTDSDEWGVTFIRTVAGMVLVTATMLIVLRSVRRIRSRLSGKTKSVDAQRV